MLDDAGLLSGKIPDFQQGRMPKDTNTFRELAPRPGYWIISLKHLILRSVVYLVCIYHSNLMEESRKFTYVLPVAEVIEISHENMICQSGEIPTMEPGWDMSF